MCDRWTDIHRGVPISAAIAIAQFSTENKIKNIPTGKNILHSEKKNIPFEYLHNNTYLIFLVYSPL